MDLPGWQKLYTELKDQNLEIIAAAQDTGGEAAAGKWYDTAKATYTTLIDTQHAVSSAYQFTNVPMGIWVDETGRVVRPAEPAWTVNQTLKFGGRSIQTEGEAYIAALCDWVKNGERSVYVLSDEEFAKKVRVSTPQEMEADASFKLAVWFHQQNKPELAAKHWRRAQELNPNDWNYHRQDWSFGPQQDAGKKWLEKFQKSEGEYYPKLDIKK